MMSQNQLGFTKIVLIFVTILVLFDIVSAAAAAGGGVDGNGDDDGKKLVQEERDEKLQQHRHAYVTMMYMGTPRDYEFYVATRVMLRSLSKLNVEADLVVIASLDVPMKWVHALEREDGAKVVRVQNMDNPYEHQIYFNSRFKLTLNKLYAWSLVQYDRVVMLDADNLFLHKTDELFQCGQFCAVFINPCIFHTGLFVLQPSMEVFNNMRHELDIGRRNSDGADQGFLVSYFDDLLDMPMFHPPVNGTKLQGNYRLPLGYQMDASYFCKWKFWLVFFFLLQSNTNKNARLLDLDLKLKWTIPCGPNSVIAFPSAPLMKPWYWWSYPVLPLGLSWHEQRRQTLGYSEEIPIVLIQSVLYLVLMAVTCFSRPNMSKLCYRRPDHKSILSYQTGLKMTAMCSILAAYIVPCLIIPKTLHPILGWFLYLLGSSAFCFTAINSFLLPAIHVLMPWLGIFGALMAMSYPWYGNGIQRALGVFFYAFCASPVIWGSLMKINACLNHSIEKENCQPRQGETTQLIEFNKLC